MLAGIRMDRERVDIDAVVDGGGGSADRVSIGVAIHTYAVVPPERS